MNNSLSGTRDYFPKDVENREYIFNIIKNIFKKYGFQPIETPAIENLTNLTGKYGEEGEKLIYTIENNDITKPSNKGLRYDLTVPLSRFINQHQNNLVFPFKRFQIQPVWRGDRPQKGRYREFYQCDADVVGSSSLFNEAELILIYHEILSKLDIGEFTIKLNHRLNLQSIINHYGLKDRFNTICRILDKSDKLPQEQIYDLLLKEGLPQSNINNLSIFLQTNNNSDAIDKLSELKDSGISDILELYKILESFGLNTEKIKIDLSLVRGLDYYTGIIFEVVTPYNIGSIGGGGRYDNLNGFSSVGMSLGAERIYDILLDLGKLPNKINTSKVLVINYGFDELKENSILYLLRKEEIYCEKYPDKVKLNKQFSYADKKGIFYCLILGENEHTLNKISIKNMKTGEQQMMTINEIIDILKNS